MSAKAACVISALAMLIVAAPLASAKKYTMVATQSVPAARGEVDVDKDHNGNTKINIEVEHLAKPGELTPAAASYVVWVQQRGGQPINEGQLTVDKDLKGEFTTVTPYSTFDLFITAESGPVVQSPSGTEVLRVNVQP
jgi:hypothetical protein